MRLFTHIFLWFLSIGLLGGIAAVAVVAVVINYYARDLPDYEQLKDYAPPIVTRLYAGDGRLMMEYAREKRVFVPISQIPDLVKNAFLAAEDQNFYEHQGVDPTAIARAASIYLRHLAGENVDIVGGSTITQQVVKNFLLTNERSFERKIKEAILAYRMEKALSKDRILELYLNQIYFGGGSYGVAAAALDYFDKALDQLTVADVAYLAALPKAPNNYHPVRQKNAAIARRGYVIDRMLAEDFITPEEAEIARADSLTVAERTTSDRIGAPYFAEEVRRELEQRYGEDILYGGGLSVHTSVDPTFQRIAVKALQEGLMAYDKRQKGWRGPLARLGSDGDLLQKLKDYELKEGLLENWRLAIVSKSSASKADLLFQDETRATLPVEGIKWTKKNSVSSILKTGDVIVVERLEAEGASGTDKYKLEQIPGVRGAIVAIDPHTGRVLAMQGGWSYGYDQFNRATQAKRQPGSAFKPFVYLTALEKGFTPATLVLDAPFVITDDLGRVWSPSNYTNEYYGPTPIRVGIEKSRNLMTVRLANYVGMEAVSEVADRFGIAKNMPQFLPNSLGSWETTLLDITAAYAILVNGGKKVNPTFVDRIQDRYGKTIFKHDTRECSECGDLVRWTEQDAPALPDPREQIVDEKIAHQIVSIMEGVVQRGTGVRLKELNRPMAGKTGTTNEAKDTWFIGFTPDLVAGVYVGYDEPQPLGKKQTGSSVALPVFKSFIKEALAETPPTPFRIPKGVRMVRVDANDGTLADPSDQRVIWESFIAGTEPDENVYLLDADGRIRRLPSVLYRDNYITMTDNFARGAGLDGAANTNGAVRYTDRNTGQPRVNAATTGTGGLY